MREGMCWTRNESIASLLSVLKAFETSTNTISSKDACVAARP